MTTDSLKTTLIYAVNEVNNVTKLGHSHSSNTVLILWRPKKRNTDNSKLNQQISKFNKR